MLIEDQPDYPGKVSKVDFDDDLRAMAQESDRNGDGLQHIAGYALLLVVLAAAAAMLALGIWR